MRICISLLACNPNLKSNILFLFFQVLNLFLALLLSSFGASNLSAAGGTDNDANKLTEAFNRIGRLRRWIKKWAGRAMTCITQSCIECCRRQISARRGTYINNEDFRIDSRKDDITYNSTKGNSISKPTSNVLTCSLS